MSDKSRIPTAHRPTPPPQDMRFSTFVFDRALNIGLAIILGIPALFVIALIYIVHICVEKRPRPPFFYAGIRLGLNRKPYIMYKIRTLKPDGDFEKTGAILGAATGRELSLGRFLRESRLDELPQLWNVIRSEMDLVGPRPVRPSVYRQLRKEIPNCNQRFLVRPGLTGHAQFLTPSRTPKRIRFAIDNYWIQERHNPWRELFLILWTILVVLRKVCFGIGRKFSTKVRIFRKRKRLQDERAVRRFQSRYILVQFTDSGFTSHNHEPIHIHDINHEAFCFFSDHPFPTDETFHFWLIGFKECATRPSKRARCCGYVYRSSPAPDEANPERTRYVVFYQPITPRHRYLVDNYVLHEMMA